MRIVDSADSSVIASSSFTPASYTFVNPREFYVMSTTLSSNMWQMTNLECERCGRVYKRYSSLRRHQRVECGKEPSIKCAICPYKVYYSSTLTLHMINVHGFKVIK